MTIKITRPSSGSGSVAIGGAVTGATAGGVLYTDGAGNLAQDAAEFFWDATNNRLGIGLNVPTGPIDSIATAAGATLSSQIKNTATDGAASWKALNDSNHSLEFGVGGSTRSDILQSSGFTFSSNGGTSWVNAGTGAFRWAIGGVAATNVFMSLDSTAKLGIGLAGTITGSIGLSGLTSGTVTVKTANAAGTWTLTLPTNDGTAGQTLQTDGNGVTSWASGSGVAIGDAIGSATAGSVFYADASSQLAQDNSNFFWDATNKALGIGKNSSLAAAVPVDILKSASGATVYGNVKNSDSTGAAGWRGTNDLDNFVEYGFGGSGRSDEFDNAGYFFSSAGGIKFATGSADGFKWLINGVTAGAIKMALNSTGQLGVGMTANTILSLFEANAGGTTSATVRNDSNSGACSWKALNDQNHSGEFGFGGSARGDNFQDRTFFYSTHGGYNFSAAGDNIIEFTVNGIATTDRVLCMQDNKIGFLGTAPQSQQASGANLTNNVTAGGSDDTIADFTSLVVYATDAAAIRNDIYQLARKLKQVNDALRVYGLLS